MNVFDLVAKITIDKKEYESGISSASKGFEELKGKASKIVSGITKMTAVGVSAVATGIGVIAKNAMSAYANYEQLVGGVETLFKESSNIVQKYANNAYKTAGLSANEYMETVTSFSASLLQSLGGDTKKAAEKANTAIIDMSDNANKMGTSMESIQNAYQGFAKQNYTMLDNLKLGYGGTKEEMQRLLKDAEKLSGKKFDLSSYADIVDAIHVVQTEMGITGTTAKEASSTITGSIGMMKSAWKNLLTGMSDPNQNFGTLMNNFVDSVVTAANNIVPRLVETVPRVAEGLMQIAEKLIPHISTMIEKLLPALLKGAVNLTVSLAQNIPSILKSLGTALYDSIKTILSEIRGMLPEEENNAFSAISDGFMLVWDVCLTVWNTIGKPTFDMIVNVVSDTHAWFNENFGDIKTIAIDTFSGIDEFWQQHLKPCFEAIGQFIENVLAPLFNTYFKNFILPVVGDTFKAIGEFWDNTLKPVFTGIIDFLTGVFSGDWELAFKSIVNIADATLKGIVSVFQYPFDRAQSIVKHAIDTIRSFFNFEWKLPDLKLPHFKIDGQFSLNPPSVPTFGIDWYAKAMNNPMIMNTPTAFGINQNGQIMAGGEAGSEVVSGTDTLMRMIENAVKKSSNYPVIDYEKLATAIVSAMTGFKVEMDGMAVGKMVNNKLSVLQARGSML